MTDTKQTSAGVAAPSAASFRRFLADPGNRAIAAPLSVGALAVAVMLIMSSTLGLPIRDPDAKYVGSPLGLIALIAVIFLSIDVLPRAVAATRRQEGGFGTSTLRILRERWGTRRGLYVVLGIIAFYASYVSYRNIKSYLPFVRGDEFDAPLLEVDRFLFFGQDPGPVLHSIFGTGIAPQILSFVYVGFLSFVPLSLGAALVWSTRIRPGLWYVTALCIAWLLGAASYYMLPSLGPAYAAPSLFADLPVTGVTQLQGALFENRLEVIYDPQTSGGVQSIAAFASLHVAVILVAALICQLLRLPRLIRYVMWTFFGLTCIATIYFGWHYVVDDFAGLVIGFASVYLAGRMTGENWRPFKGRDRWGRRIRPAEPPPSARSAET